MNRYIVGLFKTGVPAKIIGESKTDYKIEEWDEDEKDFVIRNLTKEYVNEGSAFQQYKIVTKSELSDNSLASLLYPNQVKPIINSSLVTINGIITIINFYSNNGKFGTEEKLDDFDLENLKKNIINFSEKNPKRALDILQEIYEDET